MDLEAVEMAVRSALHRAGARALSRLLSMDAGHPAQLHCQCGQTARYHDRRPKHLLALLGPLEMRRAYYHCAHCRQGHSPRDRELDVEGTECSPGVRRMLAVVGSESSFEQGRAQLQLLAGLDVTTKAVERHAEAIGADIARREQAAIRRAKQLELPAVCERDRHLTPSNPPFGCGPSAAPPSQPPGPTGVIPAANRRLPHRSGRQHDVLLARQLGRVGPDSCIRKRSRNVGIGLSWPRATEAKPDATTRRAAMAFTSRQTAGRREAWNE